MQIIRTMLLCMYDIANDTSFLAIYLPESTVLMLLIDPGNPG